MAVNVESPSHPPISKESLANIAGEFSRVVVTPIHGNRSRFLSKKNRLTTVM